MKSSMAPSIFYIFLIAGFLRVDSFAPHMPVLTSQKIKVSTTRSYESHYPTEGGMFDINKGPSHHLIEVAPEDLVALGDKSVEVHELKVDAATLTFASFGAMALFLFVLAFIK